MKLPHGNKAIVPRRKLTNYLLSTTHPVGKSKAKIFRKWGFAGSSLSQFETALLKIARTCNITSSKPSEDASGTNYEVDGKIVTPLGGTKKIKTVWYLKKGQVPRLVTARPLK